MKNGYNINKEKSNFTSIDTFYPKDNNTAEFSSKDSFLKIF